MSAALADPAQIGTRAPLFTEVTLTGDTLSLGDLRGKVVLLDFWASWCAPCRKEMPFLVKLRNSHSDVPFEIVAVNVDKKVKNAKRFLARLDRKPRFPIVLDAAMKLPPLYRLKAMPTTLFIDRAGVIRFRHKGFAESEEEEFGKELEELLAERATMPGEEEAR